MAQIDLLSIETCKNIMNQISKGFLTKSFISIGACGYTWIFENPNILIAVYVLIIFDTITGLIKAIQKREVSSSSFFRVLVKCLIYFVLIITGRLVDKVVPVGFASSIIESFLVVTEALSIIENLNHLGFPVPTQLVKILKQISDTSQKNKTGRFYGKGKE